MAILQKGIWKLLHVTSWKGVRNVSCFQRTEVLYWDAEVSLSDLDVGYSMKYYIHCRVTDSKTEARWRESRRKEGGWPKA